MNQRAAGVFAAHSREPRDDRAHKDSIAGKKYTVGSDEFDVLD